MPLGPPAMSPSFHLLRKSEAKIRFLDVAENFNQGALHHVGRCFALLSQLGERGQRAAVTPTVKNAVSNRLTVCRTAHRSSVYSKHLGWPTGEPADSP